MLDSILPANNNAAKDDFQSCDLQKDQNDEQVNPLDPPRPGQMQHVINQLVSLEALVAKFESDIPHFYDDIEHDIDAIIEATEEDLGTSFAGVQTSRQMEFINQYTPGLYQTEQHVNHNGEQVELVSGEVGNLIIQSDSTVMGISQINNGVQQLKHNRATVSALSMI